MSIPGIFFYEASVTRTPHLGRPGEQSVALFKLGYGLSPWGPGDEAVRYFQGTLS